MGISFFGGGGGSGGTTLPVADTTEVVKGSADATKKVRIEADSITTGTTRVWTAPDCDVSIGKIAQIVTAGTSAVATTTATIPDDDTIPQNTEGTELAAVAVTITPTHASSTLIVEAHVSLSHNMGGDPVILALFRDATANAIAAVSDVNVNAQPACVPLIAAVAAGSTAATTFKLRYGASGGGGTVTINGFAGARKWGGVALTRMKVTEVLP